MIQKPEKPQAPAAGSPASAGEVTWIIVFLAFCMAANSWLLSNVPEQAPAKAPKIQYIQMEPAAPAAAPERPGRDRPSRDSDRPWRDPASNALPSF